MDSSHLLRSKSARHSEDPAFIPKMVARKFHRIRVLRRANTKSAELGLRLVFVHHLLGGFLLRRNSPADVVRGRPIGKVRRAKRR